MEDTEYHPLPRYIPSEKMRDFILREVKKVSMDDVIPRGIQNFIANKDKTRATICLEDIEWVRVRRAMIGRNLFTVLRGTQLILPKPCPDPPRNPELEARCQRLRREQEEREYRAMTKMIDPKRYKEPEESIAYQLKQINKQLIAVAQVVFSVAAGFFFGFLGLELIFGGLDMRFRLLCGIGFAVVIAIADLYFLMVHLYVEDTKTEEAKVIEKAPKSPSKKGVKLHQE